MAASRDRTMGVRRHAWLVYLAVMGAISVAYLAGPLNEGPVFNAIGFSAVLAIVVGVRMHRPGARWAWYLVALSQVLFVAGDVLAYNYKALFGAVLPFPSIADAVYLAVYPTIVAGLLLLIRHRNPGRDWGSLVDSVIVTIGLGLLSWVFLIAPYAADHTLHLGTKLVSMAYPFGDILILGVGVRIAVGAGRRSAAYHLMIGAIVATLATDSIYGWILLHGTYHPGDLLDGGWIAYYLLWGAAALHPSMTTVSDAAAGKAKLTPVRIAAVAAAALVAPVIIVVRASAGGGSDDIVVGCGAIVLFALVIVRMIGLARESTALRESLVRTESEARLSALVQHSSDVIFVLASDTSVEYVSPSLSQVLGFDAAEVVGQPFVGCVAEHDRAPLQRALARSAACGSETPEEFEFGVHHRNGSLLQTDCLVTNLLANPAVGGIVVNLRDVTERKQFEERLTYQAFHDPVTGLANRALFRDRVEHALSRRRDGLTLTVLFLDLDDFKSINDTLGHDAGDQLLRTTASRLGSTLRVGDTLARLGGDEFAVVLEDTAHEMNVSAIVERMLEVVRAPISLAHREVSVSCSIGIAVTGEIGAGVTVDELLRNADVAMYEAKAAGGDTFRHFMPEMHASAVEQLELRADLTAAVKADELTLAYQPIFDVVTGEISGYEALLRWEHAVRGRVPPATFIPAAESAGLIFALGRWVLERACQDAVDLQRAGPHTSELFVSVNISTRQLERTELVDEVEEALLSSGLDPSCLVLEITESLLIDDVELAVERLTALCELGVRVAMDDFGTGYSSLNYIRHLPIAMLKIDKRFIDSVDADDTDGRLTAAMIGLARVLNLDCVAEGVERPAQYERLKALGCDYAQGFLLARPMSPPALLELLRATADNALAAA